jgi:ABC-type bacteriocin/lantibiotic exporter with double-glycine peptidase domain
VCVLFLFHFFFFLYLCSSILHFISLIFSVIYINTIIIRKRHDKKHIMTYFNKQNNFFFSHFLTSIKNKLHSQNLTTQQGWSYPFPSLCSLSLSFNFFIIFLNIGFQFASLCTGLSGVVVRWKEGGELGPPRTTRP